MASSQSISEAMQNALPAFDLIVGKRLDALTFDRTVKATIIDTSNSAEGEYIVTDGSSTYKAYCDVTTYTKNTVVYVTIPEGDYQNQKIITGRYISDNTEYFTYVDPMKSFLDITKNLITTNIQTTPSGLKANGTVDEKALWSIHGRTLKGYDKLAIKADFKSWLKEFKVRTGTYGLRLDIIGTTMGTTQTSNSEKLYSVVLNTNDFYGDPYNYETYYTQTKVVDISEIENIESMRLVFYQGKDFKTDEGFLQIAEGSENINDLFVNNIYISLGYDLEKFTEDTVLLYTLDSATYASYLSDQKKADIANSLQISDYDSYEDLVAAQVVIQSSETAQKNWLDFLNQKDLHCRWIHFVNEDTVVGYESFPTGGFDPNEVVVHWYRQNLSEGVNDPLAGAFWEEILEKKNQFEYLDFQPDVTKASEKIKVLIECPSTEYAAKAIHDAQFSADAAERPFGDFYKSCYIKVDIPNRKIFNEFSDPLYILQEQKDKDDVGGLKYVQAERFSHADTYYKKITTDNAALSKNDTGDSTYYDWVMRGISQLEDEVLWHKYLLTDEGVNQQLETLYKQYQDELKAANLQASDSAANDIIKKYKKLMLDVEQNTQNQISSRKMTIELVYSKLAKVNYYYSAILDFTNEDASPNLSTIDLLQALQLSVDEDGYKGNYRVYDENGEILNKSESQKRRIITASWDSLMSDDRSNDNIESITWRIPLSNTMIQPPQEEIEYSKYDRAIDIQTRIDFENCERDLYIKNANTKTYSKVTVYDNKEIYYYKGFTTTVDNDGKGYFVITRPYRKFETHEDGVEEANSSEQVFRIKDFWTQSATNNTIYCTLRKNNREYNAQVTLHFGTSGTNGTNYKFELEIQDEAAVTINLGVKDTINVIPHLYNFEGEDITNLIAKDIKYTWYSPGSSNLFDPYLIIGSKNNNTGVVPITTKGATGQNIDNYRFYILKAEITVPPFEVNDQHIPLDAYLPIPVRTSILYNRIDGATRISYDSQGINPSYFKEPYKLYQYYNSDKKTDVPKDNNDNVLTQIWEMAYGSDTQAALMPQNDKSFQNFYPILSTDYRLIPPAYYMRNMGRHIAVNCKINGQIVWTQPIYIYQNAYTSALLNTWDGELAIDEETGTILATAIGAGSKDERNRFNGVLMGDVNSIINEKDVIEHGLFGYNEGVQSFGFKIDGTAFIGKSGKGQIQFDGNSGEISSASYQKGSAGMLIDLDDGLIDMRGVPQALITFNVKNFQDNNKITNYPTVSAALNALLIIVNNTISSLNSKKTNLNNFYNAVDIVYIDKEIEPYKKLQKDITTIKEELSKSEYDTDWKKIKYIQENGYSYLLNNEFVTTLYGTNSNLSQVRISTTNPYFYIQSQHDQKKLIYIGENAYFLQTDNFHFANVEWENYKTGKTDEFIENFSSQEYGDGFLIDLQNGYILGYNFKLKGVNSENGNPLKDSYFELNSSGEPFLIVHYRTTDINTINKIPSGLWPSTNSRSGFDGAINTKTLIEKNLIKISKEQFYLQSWHYIPSTQDFTAISGIGLNTYTNYTSMGQGLLLDLTEGQFKAHNFTLEAINVSKVNENNSTAGSYVVLSSTGQPFFRIHYQYKEKTTDVFNSTRTNEGIFTSPSIDLINVSLSNFYINSRDFQRPSGTIVGSGIRLNLNGQQDILNSDIVSSSQVKGSYLEAYSFKIDAYRPGLYNQDLAQRIRINSAASGDALISNSNYTVAVPNLDYILAHSDVTEETIQNQINTYYKNNPGCTAAQVRNAIGSDKVIIITTKLNDDPLMLGALFSVNWQGRVKMNYFVANQGGIIGPFKISSYALYSNNGKLAGGINFGNEDELEPQPYGVYLGRDGFSVRKTFAVFKFPINHNSTKTSWINSKGTAYSSGSTDGFDFVSSSAGNSTNTSDINTTTSNYSYNYEQSFKTKSGTVLKLKDLSFYLNGNSVLNGHTVLNNNTYIFGRFEVGEIKNVTEIGVTDTKTNNQATLYADTDIYGILKVSGRTIIGGNLDSNGNVTSRNANTDWAPYSVGDLTKFNDNTEKTKYGFIVLRNSYINGHLLLDGDLTVGRAYSKNQSTVAKGSLDSVEIVTVDSFFKSYTANSYFYGNLTISKDLIAGYYYDSENAGTAQAAKDTAIRLYGKTLVFGRPKIANSDSQQSNLTIRAKTYQYGTFVAGLQGNKDNSMEPVYLYGGRSALFLELTNKNNNNDSHFVLTTYRQGTIKGNISDLDLGKFNTNYPYIEGKYTSSNKQGIINIQADTKNYIKLEGATTEPNSTPTMTIKTTGDYTLGSSKNYIAFDKEDDKLTINLKTGDFIVSASSWELSTSGNGKKAYIKGDNGAIEMGGNVTINESSTMTINGNLKVNGNFEANNLTADKKGQVSAGSSGTPFKGYGNLGGGALGSTDGTSGWIIKPGYLEDLTGAIKLNATAKSITLSGSVGGISVNSLSLTAAAGGAATISNSTGNLTISSSSVMKIQSNGGSVGINASGNVTLTPAGGGTITLNEKVNSFTMGEGKTITFDCKAGTGKSSKDINLLAFASSLKKKFNMSEVYGTVKAYAGVKLDVVNSEPSGGTYKEVSFSASGTKDVTVHAYAWVDDSGSVYAYAGTSAPSGYNSATTKDSDSYTVKGASGKSETKYVKVTKLTADNDFPVTNNYKISIDDFNLTFEDDLSDATLSSAGLLTDSNAADLAPEVTNKKINLVLSAEDF